MNSPTATDSLTGLSPSQRDAVTAIADWFTDRDAPQVFRMYGVAGTGKALRNGTLIPTPNGPRAIEALEVDSEVFGRDGTPIRVMGVFPQGSRDGYRVTFRDGSWLDCDGEHLWLINTRKIEKVMTTLEILATGVRMPNGDARFRVPLMGAAQYPARDLPIAPYALGALIGDGTALGGCPTLCLGDQDSEFISSRVALELPEWAVMVRDDSSSSTRYRITDPRTYRGNAYRDALVALELNVKSPERFIPRTYLEASSKQRLELLHGLMDTDGSCVNNRTSFTTHSSRLAHDVVELVQSLGGTAIIRAYPRRGALEHQVNVKMLECPFSLPRKAARWSPSSKNPPSRYITAIEPIGVDEYTCISVAATDGLFAASSYIVTHNTTIARILPAALGLRTDDVRYAALAGKAAMVLRSKGCEPASTLHKLVYKPAPTMEALRAGELADELRARQVAGETGLAAQIMEAELAARKTEWARNPDSEIRDIALLICDEVSMVGPQLGRDLEGYGTRILVIGDPEQLPPVDGSGYFTSAPADVNLAEIHRQALDSPVLELATRIRDGRGPVATDYARVLFNPSSAAQMAAIAEHYDQVLVGRRKTRWAVVHGMRRAAGRVAGAPAPGDRIMCIANSSRMGIFNGQQFEVVEALENAENGTWTLTVAHDGGGMQTIDGWAAGFEDEAGEMWAARNGRGSVAALTFAQAVTVHKAQGSEWRRVLVVDESDAFAWHEAKTNGPVAGAALRRHFLYTATTRASKQVTLTRVAR